MTPRVQPVTDIVLALSGPLIWAAHFFVLYLTEAFACAGGETTPTAMVRWIGAIATAAALFALGPLVLGIPKPLTAQVDAPDATAASFAFATPLNLLSMIAIVWTSIPLILMPACLPAPA
jgi:hypothetical protein